VPAARWKGVKQAIEFGSRASRHLEGTQSTTAEFLAFPTVFMAYIQAEGRNQGSLFPVALGDLIFV
jgi:hypothetical protein